jgi:hypothetical protein
MFTHFIDCLTDKQRHKDLAGTERRLREYTPQKFVIMLSETLKTPTRLQQFGSQDNISPTLFDVYIQAKNEGLSSYRYICSVDS